MPAPIIERGISEAHLVCLAFGQTDLAISQTDVQLVVAIGEAAQANDGYVMPWAGEVLAVSYQVTAAPTAGVWTVGATINGTEDANTRLTGASDSATVKGTKAITRGLSRFAAADVIGVELSTDANFLPITTDLSVLVWAIVHLEGV